MGVILFLFLALYGLSRVRSVAHWHGFPNSVRFCCIFSSWFCVFAYDCVERALHFDLCRWQPAQTRYHFILLLRSASEGFGVILSVLRFGLLGISTTGLQGVDAVSVSLLHLMALLSPCMSSMAMFLGNIARASLCLHFTFLWRRCMLWTDFSADDKLNGCKENECFCATLCVTLCKNGTSTVLERGHDLPWRMFLWTVTTVTIMKNTRTYARPVEQNLLFTIC